MLAFLGNSTRPAKLYKMHMLGDFVTATFFTKSTAQCMTNISKTKHSSGFVLSIN